MRILTFCLKLKREGNTDPIETDVFSPVSKKGPALVFWIATLYRKTFMRPKRLFFQFVQPFVTLPKSFRMILYQFFSEKKLCKPQKGSL